ncbi:MAG: ribbon-helix-helix domain-containing protein [Candidatus Dormibacteria bacterium]
MAQVALRLPDRLMDEVDSVAAARNATRSDVIRAALEQYLYRLACERDAAIYEGQPLTDKELALADDPDGWSITPQW